MAENKAEKPATLSTPAASTTKAPAKVVPANTSSPEKSAKAKAKPAKKKAAKPAASKKKTAAKKTVKKAVKKSAVKAKAKTTAKAKPAAKSAAKKTAGFDASLYMQNAPQTLEKIMSQGKTQMDKMAQDATDLSRQNVEVVMKSSNIFVKGCEDIMRTAMSIAQDAAEKQSQFMKEVMSTKTLNEWTSVQSKIAQTSFDDFMAGATKISEMSVKTLTDSVEPINAHVTSSVQKTSKLMAA